MLGTAVFVYFGFGLAPVAALAWLVPLPALLAAPRLPAWLALAGTFAGFVLGTTRDWGFYSRSHDEPLSLGLTISAGFALTLGLAVLLFRALVKRNRAMLAAAAAPAVWVGVLYLVAVLNPAGIVGTFAATQGDVPVVLQVASVTGFWGVDYLVVFVAAVLAAVAAPGVARLRTAVLGVVVVAVCLGFGIVRLAQDDPAPQRVAMIADDATGWAPTDPAVLKSYVDRIAALPPDVRTVVLPEGAFGTDTAGLPGITTPLQAVARRRHVDIVAGIARTDGTTKYNEAYTFPADGGAPSVYLKWHDRVTKAGHDLVFPPVDGARAGVVICGDVAFRTPFDGYGRGGARILYLPASTENDNGTQMSRSALLRGVENGLAIVWTGRTGELMASDGRGRVAAVVHTGGPFTTLITDVAPGPGGTPYSRLGDWFAWLCVAGALVSCLFTKTRRARPHTVEA
ncbi:apolipoprotein N-acyltransferase [Labedaea rhizosphaerae]|uniref:Apolipoprotein N-acyltransferase n=2 Tax=Labedaea rhizosphaerae TaxID=598644 RepID=A0A4R6S3A0_LABRH|nr:apolipoprotein N-acyltransferase [Labedaea rhizosphaerae]